MIFLFSLIIAWTGPLFNPDGTLTTDLAEYRIYEASNSNLTDAVQIGSLTNNVNPAPSSGDTYQFTYTPATNDTWFTVTAVDSENQESAFALPMRYFNSPPGVVTIQLILTVP